jgi:hypothetical protein
MLARDNKKRSIAVSDKHHHSHDRENTYISRHVAITGPLHQLRFDRLQYSAKGDGAATVHVANV